MNKIILITCLVLMVAGTALNAQSKIGLKGGVNFSNLAVDEDQIDENHTKVGWTAGIFTRTNFDGVGLQAELLYTRKGAKYDILATTVDANLDYLELPITLQLRLFGSPLTVYAGGYAAYLLNARYEYESNLFNGTIVYDDPDGFNEVDYGLLGGLNLTLGQLVIDARLMRGLQDVEAQDHLIDTQPFTANETKNFGLLLSAGIVF